MTIRLALVKFTIATVTITLFAANAPAETKSNRGPSYEKAIVRDHRTQPIVRDHRTEPTEPIVRDHRTCRRCNKK